VKLTEGRVDPAIINTFAKDLNLIQVVLRSVSDLSGWIQINPDFFLSEYPFFDSVFDPVENIWFEPQSEWKTYKKK